MYLLHKALSSLATPLMGGIFLAALSAALSGLKKRRGAAACAIAAAAWLWVWATPWWNEVLSARALRDYPPQPAEALPSADAIVVLGGGMYSDAAALVYADLQGAADRVWHAARLWKAGKAPVVIPTGTDEGVSSAPLLADLGVPPEAVRVEGRARNTVENARFVAEILAGRERPTILLVTSAWHMRRAMMEFGMAMPGAALVPAPADYDALAIGRRSRLRFWPLPSVFADNSALFKEWLGMAGARLRR